MIELIIVLAILTILYMIILPAFRAIRNEGNDTRARKDVSTLELALGSYFKNNGSYPFEKSGANPSISGYGLSILTTAVPMLIGKLPDNPFFATETYASGKGAYIYHITHTNNKAVPVTYLTPSNSIYHILSRGQDGILDGVTIGTGRITVFGDDIVVSNAPIQRDPGHRPGTVPPYPF